MKQTAVHWLIKELEEIGALNINGLHWSDKDDVNSAIEKAKEIEKKQIIDANIAGMEFIAVDPNRLFNDAEQYYNETFENK